MKTKIITGLVIASITTAGALAYASDSTNTGSTINNIKHKFEQFSGSGGEFKMGDERGGKMGNKGFGMIGPREQLTDEEKTKLESMTDTEKQAFFEQKRSEAEAKVEAREAVIDKLLAGETLTDSDKKIVEEIKTQRAEAKKEREEMKAKQAEMKAKMDAIKPLLEKQKAGTTLTSDEKAQLYDAMGAMRNNMGKGGPRGQAPQEAPEQGE